VALFITGDDGGAVGSYVLQVIARFDGRLASRDLTPLISKAFGRPVRCFDPERPNVAGVMWLRTSHRFIAAAETLNHSNCDSMGNFAAFDVDPYQMAVIDRMGQLEAKRRLSLTLGPALLGADDDCVERPKNCWIPQLHPMSNQGPSAFELAKVLTRRSSRRPPLKNVLCSDDGSGANYYCMFYQRSPNGSWARWSAWVSRKGRAWTLSTRPILNPT
jgi:hypothetical protein